MNQTPSRKNKAFYMNAFFIAEKLLIVEEEG